MIYLLDVSLLIALVDQNHIHFAVASEWFRRIGQRRWATCPITENGFLRILSSSACPVEFSGADQVFGLLGKLCEHKNHHFWPDDFSLLDLSGDLDRLAVGSRDITDLYLLALAIRHGGQLATLDQRIPSARVKGEEAALHVIRS